MPPIGHMDWIGLDLRKLDPRPTLMLINSGVIRAQSRKLDFLLSQMLLGHPFQTLYPPYHACLAPLRLIDYGKIS